MGFSFTDGQRAAIDHRGSALLVSAAAGSGKTRVLTQRLMEYIQGKENPQNINRFLIITYTRAAAAELRERIISSLEALAAENPLDKNLRHQQNLCYNAHIGTIHSFCTDILREYCHEIDLPPAFKVMDEDRAQTMKEAALSKVLEDRYDKIAEDPDFAALVDTVGAGRDDERLTSVIRTLHDKMRSHPYPEDWLRSQLDNFLAQGISDASETEWGRVILAHVAQRAQAAAQALEAALFEMCERDDAVKKAYGPNFEREAAALRDFSRAAELGWDRAVATLPIEFSRLGSLRNYEDKAFADRVKAARDDAKDACSKFAELLSAPSEELFSQTRGVYPAMCALSDITISFDREFSAEKLRRGLVDFSDLEHFAARLLSDRETDRPTWAAFEISQRFSEIMADEYQDVNAVQEMIFSAISQAASIFGSKKAPFMFMVGDVKQSIYRFRLAEPGIFLEKYRSFADYRQAPPGQDVKVLLQENFRSRASILSCANHVFSNIMSRALGEMDYDSDAALKFGALDYPEGSDTPAELFLIDPGERGEEQSPQKAQLEARFVARQIKQMVERSELVYSAGQGRGCRWGDFAILLRSPSSNGAVFRRELLALGIPVHSRQGGGFFASLEVSVTINLLAIIDNPHNDVPLISVLRSPVFCFSPDELSKIRAAKKDGDFYDALCAFAGQCAHCAEFLRELDSLRDVSCDLGIAPLLWRIYSSTRLFAICSAMDDGSARRANLMQLFECAKGFESGGYKGLFRFLSYLRRMAERGEEPASAAQGSDFVQITSIHKSKGLEYPFVFLCDLSHQFNKMDLRKNLLIHPKLGIGPKVTNARRGIEFPTLARNAIEIALTDELLSEEMRVLYVAMTRARERLFMSCIMEKPEEKLQKAALNLTSPISPTALRRAPSPAAWLISAALLDGGEEFIKTKIVRPQEPEEALDPAAERAPVLPSPEVLARISENLSFSYPHSALSGLPTKLTATGIKGKRSDAELDPDSAFLLPSAPELDFRLPDFDAAPNPSAAQKGTAVHTLLEHINLHKVSATAEIDDEIARLDAVGLLETAAARGADGQMVLKFFASPLGQRILRADKVFREFRFTLLEDAEKHFDGAEGETLLLQGIVDCFIIENGEITIIDYKTDNISSEKAAEHAGRYTAQLRTYARAVSRICGAPIREAFVCFLRPGENVKLDI